MNMYIGGIKYSQSAIQASLAKSERGTAQKVDFSLTLIEVSAAGDPVARTVDDVKKEFHAYLDSLPISPGLARTPLSVNITDKAFEKMLADPEYEQRMKDLCARDLCDPAWSTIPVKAINIQIDADCGEEFLATSWNSPAAADNANPDGFWTRRTKKRAEQKEEEERAREKREMLERLEEAYSERRKLSNDLSLDYSASRAVAAFPLSESFFEMMGSGSSMM